MQENFGFGLIPSPYDSRDYTLATKSIPTLDFPETFDLGIIKVKNQGTRLTCAAHVMSEIIEYHNYKQNNNVYTRFSTDYIYGSRNDDDYLGEGMYMRDALKIINKKGDVLYEDLPGNTDVPTARQKVASYPDLETKAYPNRISSYYKISSIEEMKFALLNHGPIAAGMKWYDGATLTNNVYTYDKTQSFSGHAVMIVGWDKENWIVQNSWGIGWGNYGRFLLPIKTSFSDTLFEAYGVTDNINEVKTTSKKLDWLCLIINYIVNLLKK